MTLNPTPLQETKLSQHIMNRKQLIDNILPSAAFLCVGLDTDIRKIPSTVLESHPDDPITAFNKAIIDATAPYCVAYKPISLFMRVLGQGLDCP